MLSFATEFPVAEEVTSVAFLEAVREWLFGSPHTRLRVEDSDRLGTATESTLKKYNETLEVLHIPSSGSAAVRYTRLEKGLEWVTTIAFRKERLSSWVGIRVSCESQHPSVRLPTAKKPVLVRTLLNRLGGGNDGDLKVGAAARRLSNSEVPIAVHCMTGVAGARMPIVYVSALFRGGYVLDVDSLSDRLAGMAHVVVEPNRPFSLRLMHEVNAENAYGGSIGIYWPDGGGRRTFLIGRHHDSPKEIEEAIFDELRQALVNRRSLSGLTWASVQEQASRLRFEELKREGSTELNDYVSNFDKEMGSARQQLADAEREIGRLHAELRRHQARASSQVGISLRPIPEQDLFEGEIVGIVSDALEDARSRVADGSRRKLVLDALTAANPSNGQAEDFRSTIKELLRDYRSMDARVRSGLEELGFDITEDGKHYKLVYQGDERYTFTMSKTGGDHRGGLNLASDISRKIL